jgi:hypothetical protein
MGKFKCIGFKHFFLTKSVTYVGESNVTYVGDWTALPGLRPETNLLQPEGLKLQ